MDLDQIKKHKAVAALVHSRLVLEGAPKFVLDALTTWLRNLDRAEPTQMVSDKAFSGFSDNVSITDAASLSLDEVKKQ